MRSRSWILGLALGLLPMPLTSFTVPTAEARPIRRPGVHALLIDLAQIEAFIDHYNHRRYHESLGNVTPADAYFGRAPAIIKQRERIKRQTIQYRRLQHRKLAA